MERGYRVLYREAHQLLEELHAARELGERARLVAPLRSAELLVIAAIYVFINLVIDLIYMLVDPRIRV